jgi:hypothetical protein
MDKKVIVTLFQANGCGYCVKLKPDWDQFKENIHKINNTYNGIPIKIKEYEHSELAAQGGGKINGVQITGYPTIKIKLSAGNEEKEYDYEKYIKKKTEKYMTKFIKNICKKLAEYNN